MSKSHRKKTARRGRPRIPASEVRGRPWVIDGIDYGPAIAAASDLTRWALDLAAAEVVDWPEGRHRVRAARRYLLGRLAGKHTSAAIEDVLFTAGLLARIFEADLGMGMSDMVTILDEVGLPTEVVPLRPRAQGTSSLRPPLAPVVPLRPRSACGQERCDECGGFHSFRNAA